MIPDAQVKQLHTAYLAHSQREVPFHWHTEYLWRELLEELRDYSVTPERAVFLVAMRLKRLEKEFAPYSAKWMFRKFVDTAWFCEQLTEALREEAIAQKRKAHEAAKPAIRMAGPSGRPPPEPVDSAKRAKEVLESEAFREFVKLKEKL